jgi:hypothetical protein
MGGGERSRPMHAGHRSPCVHQAWRARRRASHSEICSRPHLRMVTNWSERSSHDGRLAQKGGCVNCQSARARCQMRTRKLLDSIDTSTVVELHDRSGRAPLR